MAITLGPLPRRVLGVLIEKALAQPEYYPMTMNAVVAACNQKSNRDPVMSATDGDVGRAIWELQQVQLAAQAEPDRNARANRFRHTTEERFGWNARERAIMAELLLRGPQTTGELRGRASRMMALDSIAFVEELIRELSNREIPFVRELPRGPGQHTIRFAHTFYPQDEALPEVGPALFTAPPAIVQASAPAASEMDSIKQRIDALEADVAHLRRQVGGGVGGPGGS